MSIGLLFWVLMVLWIVFGIGYRSGRPLFAGLWYVDTFLLFVLFFLLGWHDFGFIIHQ
jgi:hypothetical protein